MKCSQVDISLPKIVSDLKVDRLVKSLDIRHVSQIPGLFWCIPYHCRVAVCDSKFVFEFRKDDKAANLL